MSSIKSKIVTMVVVGFAMASGIAFAQQNKDPERENRIIEIQNGDFKAGKDCVEVSQALIPKQENAGMFMGGYISKDRTSISRRPTMNYFGSYGVIASVDKNTIITKDRNSISGEVFVYVLKFTKDTLWVKDNLSIGNTIYFVGQYYDNTTVNFSNNNGGYDVSARVVAVACARTTR